MNNALARFQRVPIHSINIVLGIGFMVLLGLIWIIGNRGKNELEAIRVRATERSAAYADRLELATNLRIAAAVTIERAKSYRAARDLGVPAVTFRFNLNKAKYELGRLLNEGSKMWPVREDSLSNEEVNAWQEIEKSTAAFWARIEAEEKAEPTPPAPQNETPAAAPENKDFYRIRTELEMHAITLAQRITEGRQQAFYDIAREQGAAVMALSRTTWLVLLFGLLVSGGTLLITQIQLTRLREAERQVLEEQGRKGAVFDSLSDDIVVINQEGEVVEVNRSFLDHFHLTPSELKLQDYRSALARSPEIVRYVERTLLSPEFTRRIRDRIEVKPKMEPGASSLYEVSVSPLRIGEESNGRVIVIDDVTEDERLREEVRRNRTLSAVGQITAQVAHEIYNPLGAIKLNLDLLEMQLPEVDEGVRHTIGRIKRGVTHLSTIATDLRYVARPRDPVRQTTDLHQLLDEVIEMANDRIEQSRTIIARDFDQRIPEGQFDSQQLRKAFLNLVINAIEASPQNSELTIRTRLLGDSIEVQVIDQGSGMSPETKARIFEAFYTTKNNGTGLGMMITQEIVKKHQGRIEIESEVGMGTKVSVFLPVD